MFNEWHPSIIFAIVASITGFLLLLRIVIIAYKALKPPADLTHVARQTLIDSLVRGSPTGISFEDALEELLRRSPRAAERRGDLK